MDAKQTLQKLLKKIAQEQDYEENSTIEKVKNGASIMSHLFFVCLRKQGKKDLKLFAKVAAWSEKMRIAMPIFRPYVVEQHFYTTLLGQFKNLEERFGVPEEHRFPAPKLFGSMEEYLCETLVMEDLAAEGYEDFDRRNSADLEYMSTGIGIMAQFHALSLALAWYDPEGFARTSQQLAMNGQKAEEWLESLRPKMMSNALAVTEMHKAKLQNFFNKPNSFKVALDFYRSQGKKVLIHGDFKLSNLMHRRRNGKLEMVVLDFQIVRDGDPVTDLMYFIFTGTDEVFRRAYYHKLVDYYYECLRASLLRLQVDPEQTYSEKTYRTRLEECVMSGLMIAVVLLPVVLVDENKAPRFDEDDAEVNDFAVESSALYKERFNGVLNNYVEWGLL